MLTPACQQFREGFELPLHNNHPHRLDCPACATWAQRLEDSFEDTPPSRLPPALARRLQAIPQRVVLCRDVERLYGEARRRAAQHHATGDHAVAPRATEKGEAQEDPTPDLAAAEHLTNCPRCQSLYGILESILLEPPQPLPRRLVSRLRVLAQRPSWTPPRWLQDARYAAAACLLLAASLTFVVEDASAALREAKGSVQTTTSTLARTLRSTTGEIPRQNLWGDHWEDLTNSLENHYLESRRSISHFESTCRAYTHQVLQDFEAIGERLYATYPTQ